MSGHPASADHTQSTEREREGEGERDREREKGREIPYQVKGRTRVYLNCLLNITNIESKAFCCGIKTMIYRNLNT